MVNLETLARDEEMLRDHGEQFSTRVAASYQNVLDALNYYRSLAMSHESEIARLQIQMSQIQSDADHNRVFNKDHTS